MCACVCLCGYQAKMMGVDEKMRGDTGHWVDGIALQQRQMEVVGRGRRLTARKEKFKKMDE